MPCSDMTVAVPAVPGTSLLDGEGNLEYGMRSLMSQTKMGP